MGRLGGAGRPLLPHNIAAALVATRRFREFARLNSLVYFGLVRPDDDLEPIRGFTAQAGQIDNHTMHGSIDGREVSIAQRTLPQTRRHGQGWLIAAVHHALPRVPHVLFLANHHSRQSVEETLVQHNRLGQVALEYRLDAAFAVYAAPSDALEFRALLTEPLIAQLLARPGYDYEFTGERVLVYSHTLQPSRSDLTALLHTAVSLSEALDGAGDQD